MLKEILTAWQEGQAMDETPKYKCKYCNKEFRQEKTLTAHLCEKKRRWQQEKDVGVQLGLKAYLRFYELTQGSAKLKSYEDFAESPYYNAFVKFGLYCQNIRCVNFSSYLDWLLKNNKKLDHWCKDSFYAEWLPTYLKREAAADALERALREMEKYAEDNPDLRNGFSDYFRYGNANRICHHISTGRISPWVVFNCTSGVEFLEGLSEEQIQIILPWIEPGHWQKRFNDYLADTEWVKDILKKAGL
ncbi:MAG TPA: C2H2-type zinc finger protein [Methanosarcina sp.]|nr:C2H2-type zinc finger protein [Methanosarcina sp.]